MNRFFNIRSLLSLTLLLLAVSMLVWSLNTSIDGLSDAGFLTIAIISLVTAYLLGFANWPSYRSWILILYLGPPLIMLQITNTGHEVGQMLLHLPGLLINKMLPSPTGQPVDDPFFEALLDEFYNHIGTFIANYKTDSLTPGPSQLKLMWSIPLFMACAWSGWWSSHRNSILTALIPLLALHASVLNYAHMLQGPTLQIAVFILIILMSLHQKWSLSKNDDKKQSEVHLETYARVFILASVLALSAGLVPILPAPVEPTKIPEEQQGNESNLSRDGQNIPPPSFELPEQLAINTPPPDNTSVIFLANVADETPAKPTPQYYYWRSITYDRYDGKAWSSSPAESTSYSADQALYDFSGQGYLAIHQTITKASTADMKLYWTGFLMDANQPFQVSWRTEPSGENPLLSMDMLGALIRGQIYTADTLLPKFTESQLRGASQVYPAEIIEKYLPVPNPISQRVRDLAVTLTSEVQNPYDKAQAIETYLRTYPYTVDVPTVPANREIADYFLFEIKKGYCDYYATSMVMLARAAGLPARIVIGYAGNEYDPETEQYIVRGTNAHSWVEIYFPDLGWVEFEPTANLPLIERPLFPIKTASTATPTPTPTPTPAPTLTATPIPEPKSRDGIMYEKHGRFVENNSSPAIPILILVILAICTWWYLHMQGLRFSYKTIGSMYKYIYHHGKKIHQDATLYETPSLFAERLEARLKLDHRFMLPAADELEELTALYLLETYSPHPITRDDRTNAVKTWRRLFWRLLYARIILWFGKGTRA